MNNVPLVSVIIPTFNRADLLTRAIRSVMKQTFHDFELIIVDDASKDDTEQVVKQFNDERVKYMAHEVNKGGAAARNTGIKSALGAYVAFLDDDDEYTSKKLEVLVRALQEHPEVGIVYSQAKIIGYHKKKTIVLPQYGKNGDLFIDALSGSFILYCSTLMRKRCIVYFDESLPRWQDWDFHARVLKECKGFFVSAVTAIVHWDGDRERITLNPDKLLTAAAILEDKYFIKLGYRGNKRVHGLFLKGIANTLILDNMACSQARTFLRRSFLVQPNMITFLDYLVSFGGYRVFRLFAHFKYGMLTFLKGLRYARLNK